MLKLKLKISGIKVNKPNILIFILVFTCIFIIYNHGWVYLKQETDLLTRILTCQMDLKSHNAIVGKYFEKRKNWITSNLGSIVFKNVKPENFTEKKDKKFLILVWKYWFWLKTRLVDGYQNDTESPNVLEGCSVSNCIFSSEDGDVDTADAVLVHMTLGVYPTVKRRNPNQRWIFFNDESPIYSYFTSHSPPTTNNLSGIFNWTMTYRSDSDVPVPYGRTVPLAKPAFAETCSGDMEAAVRQMVPYWDEKQFAGLAMVLMSNCQKNRLDFVNDLGNYISVDVYGKCSDHNKNKCPGQMSHVFKDCNYTQRYLFYLALENSSCHQYLSEKIFHHAYSKGAIPVISGPPLGDCEKLLPPNSFLHVANFSSIWELAFHMEYISSSLEAILSYHAWRRHFAVENEHGYFGSRSVHLCRVCQALNYNDEEEKVYGKEELDETLSRKIACDTSYAINIGIM